MTVSVHGFAELWSWGQIVPSRSITVRSWKMMVGRLYTFLLGFGNFSLLFRSELLNFRGVAFSSSYNHHKWARKIPNKHPAHTFWWFSCWWFTALRNHLAQRVPNLTESMLLGCPRKVAKGLVNGAITVTLIYPICKFRFIPFTNHLLNSWDIQVV